MDGWMNAITELGNAEREKQTSLEEAMEAGLPKAVSLLPTHSNEDLLALYDKFSGSAFWPRENEIRQRFLTEVRAEVLKRMTTAAGG